MPFVDPPAHRWLIASVLAGLGFASLVTLWVPLDIEPSAASTLGPAAKRRADTYRAQAADGRSLSEAAWRTWFQALEAADATLRVGERFVHAPLAERAMFDSTWEELAERDAAIGPLATIVDFAEQLKQRDIDFLVLPVPPLSAVYPRSSAGGAPAGDAVPANLDWRLRSLYARLEDHGVEVLDLLPLLLDPPPRPAELAALTEIPADAPSSVDLMFRLQDRHWTPIASDLAASLLATRIRRYPWFDDVTRTMGRAVVEDRWFVEAVRGPLAERLIRAGRLAADHPKEHILRHVARPQGETSSFRDRESPILIVGDSFAGPELGLLDSLLVQLGFRVDLVTVQGGLPSHQLDYLRLQDEPLAGKRLVIWEFAAVSIGIPERWKPVSVVPIEAAAR